MDQDLHDFVYGKKKCDCKTRAVLLNKSEAMDALRDVELVHVLSNIELQLLAEAIVSAQDQKLKEER